MNRGFQHIRAPRELDPQSARLFESELETELIGPIVLGAVPGASEPEVFCTGLGLSSITELDVDATRALLESFERVLLRLRTTPAPVIASIDGEAIGGGVGLVAACDWVIATPRARFGLPEVLFGLTPAMVLIVLEARMSEQKARSFALLGDSLDAEEARRIGLVDEIVEPSRLEPTVQRRVRAMRRAAKDGVAAIKGQPRVIDALRARLSAARLDTLSRLQRDDVRARMRAFAQGESPWEARP